MPPFQLFTHAYVGIYALYVKFVRSRQLSMLCKFKFSIFLSTRLRVKRFFKYFFIVFLVNPLAQPKNKEGPEKVVKKRKTTSKLHLLLFIRSNNGIRIYRVITSRNLRLASCIFEVLRVVGKEMCKEKIVLKEPLKTESSKIIPQMAVLSP